ncbi:MAG TPA: DNA translocase FtsK, partial [Planctomycetota bacterium]|nr:DNA translocase FtsK [Planctomycetota bacterium]
VVNRLTARTHDLAIRLKSGGVRFVYPIPGKSTVGVEVPNTRREFVRLRELVDEVQPNRSKAAIPLYLGRDVMNRAAVEDLTEMPHLLIAGQTGSGKSACLNAILCSILLGRSPDDVKLILVDPKQVEFSKYEGIPHLMCPIVTIARKVPIVLDWVIAEMEERYTLLAQAGVRKISDFNALSKKEIKERLGEAYVPEETRLRIPYLVVVVDEMNDLMVQAKKDMEDRITRIAQKSRAVGIHLILATQRPSVNVITGTIKANLPTRIAFQTAQGNDSRVILDQIGAEDLLGKGDFLFKPPGTDKFVRAQGTWVGDEEIERLVSHAKSLAEPRYDVRLIQIKEAPDADAEPIAEASFDAGARDALFERAVEETLEANRAAASHLQRAFAIGYNRATRILDAMAVLGIVSAYEGSKVRRILITKEEWAARKSEILKGERRGAAASIDADGET